MLSTPVVKLMTSKYPAIIQNDECPGCGGDIELHQPDIELPNRLLGTCQDCKTWYLLNDLLEVFQVIPI